MFCCFGDAEATEGSAYRPEAAVQYGWHLTKGHRWSMEDMHVAEFRELAQGDCVGCFAIFDGHGGKKSVQYVQKHLFSAIIADANFAKGDVAAALRAAYEKVDHNFRSSFGKATCGTTATTVVMQGRTIWLAHVGDSRAILCTDGKARQLTADHNPGHPAEAARMEALGAPIFQDTVHEGATLRVDGVLAVTRAFGNNAMKQWIKAEPDVLRLEVGLQDEFIIIASDGLWDTVSNDMAVQTVKGLNDAKQMAEALALRAYGLGSGDNISVLVLRLNAEPSYSMSQRAVMAVKNASQRGFKALTKAQPSSNGKQPSPSGSQEALPALAGAAEAPGEPPATPPPPPPPAGGAPASAEAAPADGRSPWTQWAEASPLQLAASPGGPVGAPASAKAAPPPSAPVAEALHHVSADASQTPSLYDTTSYKSYVFPAAHSARLEPPGASAALQDPPDDGPSPSQALAHAAVPPSPSSTDGAGLSHASPRTPTADNSPSTASAAPALAAGAAQHQTADDVGSAQPGAAADAQPSATAPPPSDAAATANSGDAASGDEDSRVADFATVERAESADPLEAGPSSGRASFEAGEGSSAELPPLADRVGVVYEVNALDHLENRDTPWMASTQPPDGFALFYDEAREGLSPIAESEGSEADYTDPAAPEAFELFDSMLAPRLMPGEQIGRTPAPLAPGPDIMTI